MLHCGGVPSCWKLVWLARVSFGVMQTVPVYQNNFLLWFPLKQKEGCRTHVPQKRVDFLSLKSHIVLIHFSKWMKCGLIRECNSQWNLLLFTNTLQHVDRKPFPLRRIIQLKCLQQLAICRGGYMWSLWFTIMCIIDLGNPNCLAYLINFLRALWEYLLNCLHKEF